MGTSFATPVISGLSAILLASQPALTPAEAIATLLGLTAPAADPTLQCKSLRAIQRAI